MKNNKTGILKTFLAILIFTISSQTILADFVVIANQTPQNQNTVFVLQTQNISEQQTNFILNQSLLYKESTTFVLQTQNITEPQNSFIVNQYQLSKDFNFFSKNPEINICSCSVFIDKITLQNTGSLVDTYELSTNKEYSKFSSNKVILNPGQKIEIINYLTPGCNEFSDEMITAVTSSSGKTKELAQIVNVGVCDNLNLSVKNYTFNTYPCTQVYGQILIKNPLNFPENYKLSSDITKGQVLFSENNTTIQGGSFKQINFTYTSSCSLYGEVTGNINVETENTELKKEIPLTINISKRYRYELNTPKEFETCNNLQTWIPITIKNNENFENTFELSIPYSFWFKLQNKTITLLPYEQKEVYIISSPKWKDAGSTFIKLMAKSKLSGEVTAKEIKVDIPDCYKYNLLVESKTKLCSDDKETSITVQNIGTKNNTFIINAVGLNSTYSKKVIIDSNDTVELSIPLNFSDEDKNYNLKIKVSDGYFNKTKNTELDVISIKKCYEPEINIGKELNVNSSLNTFNITLINHGEKDAHYYIWLDSPSWAKLSNTSVSISKNGVNNVLLRTIAGNESGKFYSAITLIESNTNTKYTKQFVINANEKTFSFNDFINSLSNLLKNNLFIIGITFLLVILLIISFLAGRILYLKRQKKLEEVRKLIVISTRKRRRR